MPNPTDLLRALLPNSLPKLPDSPILVRPTSGHPAVDMAFERLKQQNPDIAGLIRRLTIYPEPLGVGGSASPGNPHDINIDASQSEDAIFPRNRDFTLDRTVRHEAQHLDQYRRMRESGIPLWNYTPLKGLREKEASAESLKYLNNLFPDR